MELAQLALKLRGRGASPNQLRLFNLRDSYGLPRYRAHDWLNDAITTTECFCCWPRTLPEIGIAH